MGEQTMFKEDNEPTFLQLETEVVRVLKTIYDPEIPVNIYDLGLIYEIDIDAYNNLDLQMTLTAPNCPIADQIINQVNEEMRAIEGLQRVNVNLVFDPPWNKDMMSEVAKLELGFL
jgi:FeS assembly SUF system protein